MGHGAQGTGHACQHGASSPRINQINKAKQCGVEGAWVGVKCRVHSSSQGAEVGALGCYILCGQCVRRPDEDGPRRECCVKGTEYQGRPRATRAR